MKGLTNNQINWFYDKKIKVNNIYMFPRFGFTIYLQPSLTSYNKHLDTNPFTKSLDNERFLVKEKTDGFVKGNYYNNPLSSDFYLKEDELSYRGSIVAIFLIILCYVPLRLYNYIYKIETDEEILKDIKIIKYLNESNFTKINDNKYVSLDENEIVYYNLNDEDRWTYTLKDLEHNNSKMGYKKSLVFNYIEVIQHFRKINKFS